MFRKPSGRRADRAMREITDFVFLTSSAVLRATNSMGKGEARGEFAAESSRPVIGRVQREASPVRCVYLLGIGIEIGDVPASLGFPHLEDVVDLGSRQLQCMSEFAPKAGGTCRSVVKFRGRDPAKPIDAHPPLNDFERGLLLRDEQDFLAFTHSVGEKIRDRLRFAGAGRALEHECPAGDRLVDRRGVASHRPRSVKSFQARPNRLPRVDRRGLRSHRLG